MLRQYQLKNFKAFAEVDPLLIRPITLIYGPNSAGKSSIIQSLMLLKQTIEQAEDAGIVLLPKGKLVDLGSYRELIHLHEVERNLSAKFQLNIGNDPLLELQDESSDSLRRIYRSLYEKIVEYPYLSLELEFSVDSLRADISLSKVDFWLGRDNCPVITYEKAEQGLKVSQLHLQHSFWKTWWAEYQLVLPNRSFNQLNSTLKQYGISEISSRSRDNIVNELEVYKLLLSEELENLNSQLVILKQQLDRLELEIQPVQRDLTILKARQEKILKPVEDEIKTLLKEQLEMDLTEVTSLFERNQTPNNLSEEQNSQFKACQDKWNQLDQIREESLENQKPLSELLANIEFQINEIEQEDIATDNRVNEVSDGIKIIDLMKDIWQRFEKYTIEQAIEDYKNVIERNILIVTNNFLPKEKQEVENSDLETDFFSGIYEGAKAIGFLIDNSFYAGDLLRNLLKKSCYLGSMRDYPERFYTFSGSSAKQVGKSGTGSSDLLFRDPALLQKVDEKLAEFKIGYEIKIVSFQEQDSDTLSDVYAIRLIDTYSKVEVSLLDVGFGVSQVLPIIIQSMFARNQTILIEQPEVHIHPRLQTELGTLFVDSFNQFGNRFIVETHSEHLMLRLQKLVRQGKLNPNDISIIYVDKGKEGSQCIQIRMNSRGKFIDKWPDGFFEEDVREVFDYD